MKQRELVFILCILTNLTALFCVSAYTHEITRVQTLPAYVIASKIGLSSTKCGKELQNFRNAVDQRIPWSLKVLDSSGGFESGFLYGNTYWLGSRSQCLDTMNTAPLQIAEQKISNITLYRDPHKEFPPFEVNYFVAHLRHNSTLKYYVNVVNEDMISLGLCLPASCTINELILILKRIFHDKITLIDDLYSVDFQLIQVKDLKDDNEWLSSNALFLVGITLAFTFFMITIGTLYDIFVHQKHMKENATNNGNVKHVSKDINTEINLFSHQENIIGEILICFSVYTNTKEIFRTKLDTGAISTLHGVRFLGMCCIIMSHTAIYAMDFVDNKIWMWRQFYHLNNYIIGIRIVSIDFYFLLSGCLVTYIYLMSKMNKGQIESTNCKEKLIELFVHIIKRFIRLTPAYMMVLGIFQLSSVWFDKTSQFYVSEKSHETCAKYWWRNLLYINNFFGLDAMVKNLLGAIKILILKFVLYIQCMSWSWYIANDMQLYVIAMTLLILSTTYFYTAVTILGALLIGSIILSGYTSYVYEIVPFQTFNERSKEFRDVFYFLPWFRISPYVIGIITGYVLTKTKNNLILKKKIIISCWCLASACYVFVFSLYERHMSVLATAVYVALYKIFWAIPIALIIIMSFIKHGDMITRSLSLKIWVPLSRLTYCAYLLHPVIIRSIYLSRETTVHYEFLFIMVTGVGYIVISYFCSYILSVMVEIPYILLMRMFIQYRILNKYRMFDIKIS
ncbi:Nose resistant to fluoxetine protein 6 [Trachymyrmex cornetzi]|uniref:Nose resistant to fluoxetine protein 6 n=1 Tax=Trachymyrmex cornetzi TaxID=471704 RepID=A0A195EAB2_9HYME|nr:Nose resistant to fluoxetine protein 6 [Trachymyrmex cornetzi]